MMLSHARLLDLIDYDPATGAIVRRANGRIARASHAAGYVQMMLDGTMYLGHRLAWFFVSGYWPKAVIDHVNGDRADNRIANLRETSIRLNVAHSKRRTNNTSGYKGVNMDRRRGKWVAKIMVNRKSLHLGYFDDPQRAHEAYMRAALKHFGEFARAA